MGVSDAGDKIEGLDRATGIPYEYQGPISIGRTYLTVYHTDEPPMLVTLAGENIQFGRFTKEFSDLGWIVLEGDDFNQKLTRQKIDMSMCLYVVAGGMDVTEDVLALMHHAHRRGIRVFDDTMVSPTEIDSIMREEYK